MSGFNGSFFTPNTGGVGPINPLLAAQIASAHRLDKKQKTSKTSEDKDAQPDVFESAADSFQKLSGVNETQEKGLA